MRIPYAGAILILPGMAAAVSPPWAGTLSFPDFLLSSVIPNLTFAIATVLLFILGLYAYAGLARFAPYRSWIYLYLVSFTGLVCALFLLTRGGTLAGSVFVLTTILGVNLLVHVFRFDRIEIRSPATPG